MRSGIFGGAKPEESLLIMERPRINRLLEKASEKPVVLVSAGEGYGKTCAIDSFLRRRKEAIIWISLSERDNDPWHFWENISEAVGFHDELTRKKMEEIGFPESPDRMNRMFSILREASLGDRRHIIVVDDCHLVREPAITDFFNRIISFPFPGDTVILTSRTELEINTIQLFSKGILARITADDLRFTGEEIAEYFRQRDITLHEKERDKILADTEGWILAISLAAEEMKRTKKRYSRSLLDSGILRTMEAAYFNSLPASLRRFLIILSFFDRWPVKPLEKIAASLPEKLPPMEELADSMRRLSSFVTYDAYLHGFRIHRIFLDFLRERQKEITREEIRTACVIAAGWCMEHNLRIDAAINYGTARDYAGLLGAVYAFPRLLSRSAAVSILEILDRVLNDPARDEGDANYLFLKHITRPGILANLGHYGEACMAVRESIKKYEADPPDNKSSWILSAAYNTLASLSFITYRSTRDISATVECFRQGYSHYKRYPYAVSAPAASASIGSYANPVGHPPEEGEFERFAEVIAECVPYASASLSGFLSGADILCRAELAFFKGDLSNAEQFARKAAARAYEGRQYEIESKALFYLLRIHIANGNAVAGRETWERMKAQLATDEYNTRYVIHDIMTGWFFSHIGETKQIAPWLKNDSEESGLNLFFHNFETMVQVKTLFAEKRYQEALKLLERKHVNEGLGSFHLGMLELTVLKAAVLNRLGEEAAAHSALEEAYRISLPNSLDMPFIELGEETRLLAGNAPASSIPKSRLETIRNKAAVYGKKLALAAEQYRRDRENRRIYLSAQELAILTGISRGFTREKIAEDSSLSINTLKTIIKTMYAKLGALNRADAIRIATNEGILKNTS